jgi:hypothetical protein
VGKAIWIPKQIDTRDSVHDVGNNERVGCRVQIMRNSETVKHENRVQGRGNTRRVARNAETKNHGYVVSVLDFIITINTLPKLYIHGAFPGHLLWEGKP